jgi:hypothetical protein
MKSLISHAIEGWANQTVSQACNGLTSGPQLAAFKRALQATGLSLDARITGSITQGLIKDPRAQGAIPIYIEDIILELYWQDQLCPIKALYKAFRTLTYKPKFSSDVIPGVLARVMVTFPSVIRKLDLRERLLGLIQSDKAWLQQLSNTHQVLTPQFNSKVKHDFELHLSLDVNIWTYFNSSRSWHYGLKRLRGERAKLTRGLHLFAPLHASQAMHQQNWYLYSKEGIEALAQAMASATPLDYAALIEQATVDPEILSSPQVFLV